VTFQARNAFSKMSLVRSLRDNLKSLGKSRLFIGRLISFFQIGFVEEIEMIETVEADDETRQKRPTAKKRSMDVLESTVNFLLICFMKN
jgi:hypothetical protein